MMSVQVVTWGVGNMQASMQASLENRGRTTFWASRTASRLLGVLENLDHDVQPG